MYSRSKHSDGLKFQQTVKAHGKTSVLNPLLARMIHRTGPLPPLLLPQPVTHTAMSSCIFSTLYIDSNEASEGKAATSSPMHRAHTNTLPFGDWHPRWDVQYMPPANDNTGKNCNNYSRTPADRIATFPISLPLSHTHLHAHTHTVVGIFITKRELRRSPRAHNSPLRQCCLEV